MGEGKVQMPLAQRGTPLFQAAVPVDSLPYFTPSSLPWYSGSILPFYPPLKGRLQARLGTDWSAGIGARLYRLHPMLPHVVLDTDYDFLPQSFVSQRYSLYAEAVPDSSLEFQTLIKYLVSDADAYHNNAFTMIFIHNADSLRDRSWGLRKVRNRLWWENSSQLHTGYRDRHTVPGFWHSHSLSIDNHHLDNQFGSSMGRFSISSAFAIPYGIKGVRKLSAGFMSDMYHLLPLVNIHYEKAIAPRLRLQAGNYPELLPITRTELLEQFPWAGQARLGRPRMSPLDFRLRLEMDLPGRQPSSSRQSPAQDPDAAQPSISLCLRNSYHYNEPVLRQAGGSAIPSQRFEPLWHNSLSASARIKLPWAWLDQALSLELRHLPHQNGIRAPYSPMITSSTSLRYTSARLEASAELLQLYHRKDQFGGKLPEFIDLNLSASYLLCKRISLVAQLQNLLGNRLFYWKGLPPKKRELSLGVIYLWK